MANQRQALVLSCEVPGEEPLPGARYNAEKLSKFFRRAYVDARCVYGGPLTLDRAKEDINDFFSKRCDVHVLYGIFHGCRGSWKLSDGTMLGLRDILEQWDSAIQLGTAQNLLIVSDACESGCMVNEAALLGRGDIAVQASCAGSNSSPDTKGETFTEYLLWNLQGRTTANKRGIDMLVHIEPAPLTLGPCYYCPDPSKYRDWIFVNEHDGADFGSSRSPSLRSDTSEDTVSQRSHPPEQEDAVSPTGQEEIGSPRSLPEGEDKTVERAGNMSGGPQTPRVQILAPIFRRRVRRVLPCLTLVMLSLNYLFICTDTFSQRSHPPGQENTCSLTADPPQVEVAGAPDFLTEPVFFTNLCSMRRN